MSKTVQPRTATGPAKAPRTARRPGPTSAGATPVLIRLPDLSNVTAVGAVAHVSHTPPVAESGPTQTSDESEQRRSRRDPQPSGSFWKTVPGKAILALLLGAIAIACYALLSGGSAEPPEDLGPEIVWPDATANDAAQPAWQEPVTADTHKPLLAEPQTAHSTKEVQPDPSAYESSAPPITPPARDEYVQEDRQNAGSPQPVMNPNGSAIANANPYDKSASKSQAVTPQPNVDLAPAMQSDRPNANRTPTRYTDGGDTRSWMPNGEPSVNEETRNPPSAATRPEQPFGYPDTGMPAYDLRFAARPSERSAQLPGGTRPADSQYNPAPQGVLQGTIQNPPLRPQNERTGSGLY